MIGVESGPSSLDIYLYEFSSYCYKKYELTKELLHTPYKILLKLCQQESS